MGKSKRRILILEAAGRLFQHYGPLKTTVADIAREAQVGVGTVYLEFRSKDVILGTLSEKRHQSVLDAIEAALGDGEPADKRLTAAFNARLEAFLQCASRGAHARDLFAGSCAAVDQVHGSYREAEAQLFTRFLRVAVERQQLAVEDPAATARALLYAYRAFGPPFAFEIPEARLRQDIQSVHRLVILGLLPR